MGIDENAPHVVTPAEEVGAREIQAARNPVTGAVVLCLATLVLIVTVIAKDPAQLHPARVGFFVTYTLFYACAGLAYFQQPGSTARRWMWRGAWACLALIFLGGLAVFLVSRI